MIWKKVIFIAFLTQVLTLYAAITKKPSHISGKSGTFSPSTTTLSEEYFQEETDIETSDDALSMDITTLSNKLHDAKKTFLSTTTAYSDDLVMDVTQINSNEKLHTKNQNNLTTKKQSTKVFQSTNIKNNKDATLKTDDISISNQSEKEYDEYDISESTTPKFMITTKYLRPSISTKQIKSLTKKYSSSKPTTTITSVLKDQKMKLKSHNYFTTVPSDTSKKVLIVTKSPLETRQTFNKKSTTTKKPEFSGTGSDKYKSEQATITVGKKEVAGLLLPTKPNSQKSDYYYYYEDEMVTSPRSIFTPHDERAKNIFKQIGSQSTAINLHPSTINPFPSRKATPPSKLTTKSNVKSIDEEYYYEDEVTTPSTLSTMHLFPQVRQNIHETTQKPISNGKIVTSTPKINLKSTTIAVISKQSQVSDSDEYYFTDIKLDDTSNSKQNIENDGLFSNNKKSQVFKNFPSAINRNSGQPFLRQPLPTGQKIPGQVFSGTSINFPGQENNFDERFYKNNQFSSNKNNLHLIRDSPFEDDFGVDANSKAPSIEKDYPKEKEKTQIYMPHSKNKDQTWFQKSKNKKINSDTISDESIQIDKSSSQSALESVIGQPLFVGTGHIKSDKISTSKFTSDSKEKSPSYTENKKRPEGIPLCRTKSGFMKRDAYVLNCKNETVRLQSAYQVLYNNDTSFKITICATDATSHDKNIISKNPTFEERINQYQCSQVKGTCVQQYAQLPAMVYKITGSEWECVKIPSGCSCEITPQY